MLSFLLIIEFNRNVLIIICDHLKLCMSFIVLIVYTLQWLLIYRLLSHWLMISLMLCAEITRSQRHPMRITKLQKLRKFAKVPKKPNKIPEGHKENCEFYENYENYENSQRSQRNPTGITKITKTVKIRKSTEKTLQELRRAQ